MDKKLRQTSNLGVEIINSKQHVKRKLAHVVQIRVCRLTQTWCLTSLLRDYSLEYCNITLLGQLKIQLKFFCIFHVILHLKLLH